MSSRMATYRTEINGSARAFWFETVLGCHCLCYETELLVYCCTKLNIDILAFIIFQKNNFPKINV